MTRAPSIHKRESTVTTVKTITMADSQVITNVRSKKAGERTLVTKLVGFSMLICSVIRFFSLALQYRGDNDPMNVHKVWMTRNKRHSGIWRRSHHFHGCRLNHLRPRYYIGVLPLTRK